ncbi:MAG: zeta toxin family protein [Roseococcus sp.]|nr:zeta toxin family protein [Roseococcus sp.]
MTARLNVQKCLDDAVAAGRLTEATARKAESKVRALLAKGLSEAEAAARAAEELAAEAAARRRQTAIRILKADENRALAQSHPDGVLRGAMALLARDPMGRAGYSNVEGRTLAITAEAHARLAALLDRYRPRRLGWSQDTGALRRFVEALYGETADAEAAALAKAWTETTDALVARFNRAGGNLANLAAWRLPQLWDRARVKAEGEAAFRAFMLEEHARGGLRILDHDTGRPVAAEEAARIIDEAWQRIATNGASDITPGAAGGTALANSRTMHRVFEWTDAAAWFRFNDRFGQTDAGIFDSLTSHVEGLARDIALLEILGPNPAWMARYLLDLARQQGASDAGLALAHNLWAHVSGAVDQPASEFLAALGRGVRAWLTSAQLGAAMLSSIADFGTLKLTADLNGLAATRIMRRYLSLMNPLNAADRQRAVRLGLIAEGWTMRALGAMRHQMEAVGRDLPGRLAHSVLAGSGMTAHTQAARWAFGMEFSAHLAERAAKPFAALEPELRATMARYGLTPADWDIIRTRGLWQEEGVAFILPEQVLRPDAAPGRAAEQAAAPPPWRPGEPLPEDLRAAEEEALDALRHPPTDRIRTAEREALRARWRAEVEADRRAKVGELRQQRQLWLVIGPPAAGKSTVAEPLARRVGALVVDADDVKAKIPEFQGGIGANAVHGESSAIADQMLADAMARGDNIVQPLVGRSRAGLAERIAAAQSLGYSVHLISVELPADQIIRRAVERFRSEGRYVPLRYIVEEVGDRPAANAQALKGEADSYARYSTDVPRGAPPRFLEGQDVLAEPDLRRDGGDGPPGLPLGGAARQGQDGSGGAAGSPAAPPGQGLGAEDDAALRRAREQALARYLEMVNGEARFAVPEPGALDRALLLGSSRPGSIGGEFRRAFAQYKSFSVTMMTRHLTRGLETLREGDHGRYLASLAIAMTVTGAFAMQLKEIAKGRDPRDMNRPEFWGAAFAQGGGAGILGDFLYSGLSRADRGFFMTAIGGPTMGLVDDLARLTLGNVAPQFATDQNSHFGRELARFVQMNTPGTSLWYARLAMDRLMWERLQELLDPQAPRRWREMERRALREHEQQFWWRPGETAPARPPAVWQ